MMKAAERSFKFIQIEDVAAQNLIERLQDDMDKEEIEFKEALMQQVSHNSLGHWYLSSRWLMLFFSVCPFWVGICQFVFYYQIIILFFHVFFMGILNGIFFAYIIQTCFTLAIVLFAACYYVHCNTFQFTLKVQWLSLTQRTTKLSENAVLILLLQ